MRRSRVLMVSAVSLTASPASPQLTNTTITLTAIPTDNGGRCNIYSASAIRMRPAGIWTYMNAIYTTTATCTWTPATPASFTLVVWAREVGHTANYDAYATSPIRSMPRR